MTTNGLAALAPLASQCTDSQPRCRCCHCSTSFSGLWLLPPPKKEVMFSLWSVCMLHFGDDPHHSLDPGVRSESRSGSGKNCRIVNYAGVLRRSVLSEYFYSYPPRNFAKQTCLFVCPSDNWKSCEWILTKFLGGVGHVPGTNEFNFGDDPDHRPDRGVRNPDSLDYRKSYQRILMKFYGELGWAELHFGDDLHYSLDPGVRDPGRTATLSMLAFGEGLCCLSTSSVFSIVSNECVFDCLQQQLSVQYGRSTVVTATGCRSVIWHSGTFISVL